VEVATKSLRGAFILEASQGGQLTCWKTVLQHLFTFGIFVTIFFLKKKRWRESDKKKT
jgi:putative exporter of polyketide antibiotics